MRLYIITVFALLSIAGTAVYYQCAKNSQRKAEVEQNQPSAAAIPAATHQPQTKDETANLYDAGKDCLYRLYLLATIAGVLVALGGIYAIWKQTEATAQATDAAARSAKAAEDSVKLQQSAQRQWVNLEKWNVSKVNTSRTLLAITFEIVNPTKVPLTLHYVITKTADRKTNTSIPASLLTPQNPRVSGAAYDVTEKQMDLFDQSKLVFQIECVVLFADAFGKHWEQIFGRLLQGGTGGGGTASDTRNILRESDHKAPQAQPPEER
jgi:uncharacterized protein (UPF0333 family)